MNITADEITYTDVRNPKYMDAENTFIQCEVNFDHIDDEEYSGFGCCSSETSPGEPYYVYEIFQKCIDGEFGEIEAYTEPSSPEYNPDSGMDSLTGGE